ncbi:MAG: carboxylating nicotinate-nucleotide diphosphorylase [Candidatus Krumholzibacteria bacterium]|nr:carboxylating nicotinate-nucleotide diphosphorylase [Candidatus Krumholzibacteria bacterium]MDH4336644.1 carboxylating nicotinate-nucleotide diphosphorylase [Candidatus Krumholzibacteria bacterium]MDH5268987.1 carboxylating nicotinate-nucleotide diphosphorylase [Candidatus Krumholzibacteria bacterium]
MSHTGPNLQPPAPEHVTALVRAALEEDAAREDATVAYLELDGAPLRAEIRVADEVAVSGTGVAREVFRQVDSSVSFEAPLADGARARAGDVLVSLHGSARSILCAERTALNFLQRMCGIASLTARYVRAVAGTGVTILDTRKTVPLWRELDKYAVRCGGARNHRRDLHAMVLIKENHVRAAGGHDAALGRIVRAPRAAFVELEVDSPDFLDAVLASPASARIDRVMLDNFAPADVRAAVARIGAWRRAGDGRRLEVEVSGGIVLETIGEFALPGVDYISVGALTHSPPAASMSLDVL